RDKHTARPTTPRQSGAAPLYSGQKVAKSPRLYRQIRPPGPLTGDAIKLHRDFNGIQAVPLNQDFSIPSIVITDSLVRKHGCRRMHWGMLRRPELDGWTGTVRFSAR